MEKNSKADRARQFMPFSPLRGFEELIRAELKDESPKRELSEYDAQRLSQKMQAVEKGCLVRVTYYEGDGYVTTEGIVSDFDIPMRRLRVVKKEILLDDIWDIERIH
ncbi:MAG: YolD-like family protein [Ruminococcaceae bacterium]|nr:YolD-like family protein [Oscillospiraceae bacterium]